jgi:uncharacterized membrane protein YuzA (DUF378 family)
MRASANNTIAMASSSPITRLNTLKKWVSCLLTLDLLAALFGPRSIAARLAAP